MNLDASVDYGINQAWNQGLLGVSCMGFVVGSRGYSCISFVII